MITISKRPLGYMSLVRASLPENPTALVVGVSIPGKYGRAANANCSEGVI